MTEKRWAWVIWLIGLLTLVLLAIPTLGFTLVFVVLWWIGGPFCITREGDVAPFWQPMAPGRLWWRDIPDERNPQTQRPAALRRCSKV